MEELVPDGGEDVVFVPEPAVGAPAPGEGAAPEAHPLFTPDDQGEITAIGAPAGLDELRENVAAEESSASQQPRTGGQDVDGPTVIMDLPEELRDSEESLDAEHDPSAHEVPTMRKKATFGANISTVITPTDQLGLVDGDGKSAEAPSKAASSSSPGLPFQETQPLAETVDLPEDELRAEVEKISPTGPLPIQPAEPTQVLNQELQNQSATPAEGKRPPTPADSEAELRTTVAPSKKPRQSPAQGGATPVVQTAPPRDRLGDGRGRPDWRAGNEPSAHWNPNGAPPSQPRPMEWTPQGWQDEVRHPPPALPPPAPSLLPDEQMGYMVYRLALPTVDALQGFTDTALASKGVFVRTNHIRPPGTPAVVCVVHPLSGDEFHLPGEVVPVNSPRPGVAVEFQGVTARTVSDFRYFIALGIPEEELPPEPQDAHPEFTDDEVLTMINSSPRLEAQKGSEIPRENTHDVKLKDLHLFSSPDPAKADGTAPLHHTQEVSLAELINPEDLEDR